MDDREEKQNDDIMKKSMINFSNNSIIRNFSIIGRDNLATLEVIKPEIFSHIANKNHRKALVLTGLFIVSNKGNQEDIELECRADPYDINRLLKSIENSNIQTNSQDPDKESIKTLVDSLFGIYNENKKAWQSGHVGKSGYVEKFIHLPQKTTYSFYNLYDILDEIMSLNKQRIYELL